MACQGAMVDDYCWLPEEFPEEVFFLGEEEEEEDKGSARVSFPRGAAAAERRASSGMGPLPAPPVSSPFPTEFPYDIDSSLSPSPLGSAAGTDSDDEDYEDLVAGLAQKLMARSFRLSEGDEAGAWPHSAFAGGAETHKMSAAMRQYSPQSTLSPAESWTALGGGGGRSPTEPDYLFLASRKREESALDLLSAAALQVERMRLQEGAELRRALAGEVRGLLPGPAAPAPYRKNNSAAAAVASLNRQPAASGFYAHPVAHTHHQHQPQQHRAVPAPPAASWGVGPQQNRGSAGYFPAGARLPCSRPLGSSTYACPPSAWSLPSQQHAQPQPLGGSGMRAVFLGGAGTRRESSGTGVFLPRRDGNPPASKKKSGCSTVLLPARVVQALNLNLDEIGALPVSHGAGFVLNSEVIRARNRTIQTQQQQQQQLQQRIHQNNAAGAATIHPYPNRQSNYHLPTATKPAPAITQEIRLPPEWSY